MPPAADVAPVPRSPQGKKPRRASRLATLTRLAWLPVPLTAGAILLLAALELPFAYDPPLLGHTLNFALISAASLVVTYLAAWGYVFGGATALLFLGAGVLAFGLGSHVSAVLLTLRAHNAAATLHAASALLSASLHVVGALGGATFSGEPRAARKTARLLLAYLLVLGAIAGVTAAAWYGMLPPFFVPGRGATPLSRHVLLAAIALFGLAAVLFEVMYAKVGREFLRWYAVSLALLATGLVAFLLADAPGSPVSWVGRFAHYLAGTSLLTGLVSIVPPRGVPVSQGLASLFTEAKAEYVPLVEAAHDAIVLLDSHGGIRFWNEAAQRRFGYATADVFGRDLVELLVPPEEQAAVRQRFRLGAEMVGGSAEVRLRDRDGRAFWAELSLYPRRAGGETAVAIVRDVSERKQAEEALHRANAELETRVAARTAELAAVNARLQEDLRRREQLESALRLSEETFFKAFGANPAGMALSKLSNDRLVDANETFLQMVGHARKEAIGQTLEELGMWRTPQDRNAVMLELVMTGSVRNREMVLRKRSGDSGWALVSCELIPVREESMVLTVCLDITERKELERALATQKTLLEAVLEQMTDAMIVCDPNGRLLFMNRAAERRLVEVDRATFSALADWPQLHAADGTALPRERYPLQRALRGEAVLEEELQITRASGSRHHLLVSAGPLRNDRHELVAAVATFSEITRLKRAEVDLRLALADKEVLLREIRHRFRNNLQILSALFTMQSDATQSEEARVALEESRQRLFSMARLQDQLYRSAEPLPVRMSEYLQALVAALEGSYSRPGVRVVVGPSEITLDADRANAVGLITTELVTNSFKYAFPAGAAGEIGVAIGEVDGACVLRVWDTGVGLPEGFRIEEATSLGLRLVTIMVARLKGTLTIQRAAGTAVSIAFPITGPAPSHPPGPARESLPARA
jgi:PAS domain S-box-containing protein